MRKSANIPAQPMTWFVAPRYYNDGFEETESPNERRFNPLAVEERPGVLVDGQILPWPGAGVAFRVPAYDRTGNTCLVGVARALVPVPDGWMALDLDEAREAFQAAKGRAPTDREVL